jgi:hypothetical protein
MVLTLAQRQQWMRFLTEENAPDAALSRSASTAATALFDLLERCATTLAMNDGDLTELRGAIAKVQAVAPAGGSRYIDGLMLAARAFLGETKTP